MLQSILELETRYITMLKKLLDEANKKGLTRIEDTYFFANLVVYLLSFLSLRRWSLKDYPEKAGRGSADGLHSKPADHGEGEPHGGKGFN